MNTNPVRSHVLVATLMAGTLSQDYPTAEVTPRPDSVPATTSDDRLSRHAHSCGSHV